MHDGEGIGLTTIDFGHISVEDNGDPMVDLSAYDFVLDPKYYEWEFSDTPQLWARKTVADKLAKIQYQVLNGKRFKIWDPWRSRTVQRKLYEAYWTEVKGKNPEWSEDQIRNQVSTYLSEPDNPDKLPLHSTGGAVDLAAVGSGLGMLLAKVVGGSNPVGIG